MFMYMWYKTKDRNEVFSILDVLTFVAADIFTVVLFIMIIIYYILPWLDLNSLT